MADMSKVGLLLGGGIRHITATQAEVKEVPACVRKYSIHPFILNQTTRVHTQKHTNHTYTYTNTQNKIKSTLQKKEGKLHEVHHDRDLIEVFKMFKGFDNITLND